MINQQQLILKAILEGEAVVDIEQSSLIVGGRALKVSLGDSALSDEDFSFLQAHIENLQSEYPGGVWGAPIAIG